MAAFNYSDPQWNWDSLTYNSKGGGQRIKSVAARAGATLEGATAAWGKPGGNLNVTGYNPNIGRAQDSQDAALAGKLGVASPGPLPKPAGKLLPNQPASGSWGSAVAPGRQPAASPAQGSRYGLQSVAPASRSRKDILDELNQLNGYSLEFGGAVAERNMPKIQQLSEELNRFDAAERQPAAQPRVDGLNSTYTYKAPGGGVVDPTLDQRAKFNPSSNPTWAPPEGSTSVNGGTYQKPAARALLPESSAWEKLQNPFDEAYTGRLLAGAKERAARDYQQREAEMRQRLGALGATAASAPGLEQQLMTEARQGYARDFGDYERSLMNDATTSASNFNTQRAGALDAFGMNRGNLSLGFSADARAGQLIAPQVRAANAAASSAESQALMGNQEAYEYGKQESADNRAARDRFSMELASAGVDAAKLSNQAARFTLDEAIAVAPDKRREIGMQLVKLQAEIDRLERAGMYEAAKELGTVAGRIAASGGFKWIGGLIGGAVGTFGPQALLGGTIAGGAAGASIGEMLDRFLAPTPPTTGKA